MEIVFLVHGAGLLNSQSMPRFANMLTEGMTERGHNVSVWAPKPRFVRIPFHKSIRKWLGYIDQYLVFPWEVKKRLKHSGGKTIFVFTDHALGAWVPMVAHLPHVIHCHDFLAQRSSLGEIPENVSGWTGRQYQSYIRRGYSKGKNFISISQKTRDDLHKFLNFIPPCSKMVYNGLNQAFKTMDPKVAGDLLGKKINIDLSTGFILHVGGNQWYKNRPGVIEIYTAWRSISHLKLPLLLIGSKPSKDLLAAHIQSFFKSDIHFLSDLEDESVRIAYAGASVFLFPSFAEGFGWPIAEAMASGCMVITTNEAPMTEVAGTAGFYINRRPQNQQSASDWALESAKMVQHVLTFSPDERRIAIERCLLNANRFDKEKALDRIEMIYNDILRQS